MRRLSAAIIAVLIMCISSPALALEDFSLFLTNQPQTQTISTFSLIIIALGTLVVIAIMVSSIISHRKHNKKR